MKITKLLVLPLMGLILSSCSTPIKGGDMPKLTDDPGHLLNLTMSSSISGDKEIIDDMYRLFNYEEMKIEVYSNFAMSVQKRRSGGDIEQTIKYMMLKNNTIYSLFDGFGRKTKMSETYDPSVTALDFGLLELVSSDGDIFVNQAKIIYNQMSEFGGADAFVAKLNRSGEVYTYSFKNYVGDYDYETVYKLTIKNNYFTDLEMLKIMSKGNKSATDKVSVSFKYGTKLESYPEAKMPDPTEYTPFE